MKPLRPSNRINTVPMLSIWRMLSRLPAWMRTVAADVGSSLWLGSQRRNGTESSV